VLTLVLVYQQHMFDYESIKDTKSAANTDDVDFDESVDPLPGSKRVTLHSIRDPALTKSKSMRSAKPILPEHPKYFGATMRQTSLSSSKKVRAHSPSNTMSGKAIFYTTYKALDPETLKAQIAKAEPIVDPYNPPKSHMFRDDVQPEGKPHFVVSYDLIALYLI
jgi:hypothetical protein